MARQKMNIENQDKTPSANPALDGFIKSLAKPESPTRRAVAYMGEAGSDLRETTQEDYKNFCHFAMLYMEVLGVTGWNVKFSREDILNGEAGIRYDCLSRTAVFRFPQRALPEYLVSIVGLGCLALRLVLRLMFADLDYLAYPEDSPKLRALIQLAETRIILQLAQVLVMLPLQSGSYRLDCVGGE